MNNNKYLKELLLEYQKQRNFEKLQADKRKHDLYEKYPKLQQIDDEISKSAILAAKKMLTSNDKETLSSLNLSIERLQKEKFALLSNIGVSQSYFLPRYKCTICKDTGYTSNSTGTEMCSCLKQKLYDLEYNKFNIYNLKDQSFENFNYEIYSDQINKEKYNSDISPRDNIKIINKISQNFINNFNDPNEKNLLFFGNSGLGKTFISSCIANELISQNKTVLYQTAPIMLDTLINYHLGKLSDNANIYKNLLSADLLIIDDLGTENMNNMKFADLFTIINSRILSQKKNNTKTIISTNLNLNTLSSLYGERIISRIIGNYNICYFFGDDIRIKSKL